MRVSQPSERERRERNRERERERERERGISAYQKCFDLTSLQESGLLS